MGLRKSLSNTIDKLKDRFLSGQKTGGYKAEGHRAWGHQYRELPFLTFQMIDYMRYDPTLILGLAMRKAPIADAELAYKEGSEWKPGIKCDDEETGLFIIKQIERFWSQDLHKALNNQIWGWVAGEVSYKLRNGDVEYKGLTMRHSADVTALELDNKFWGVKFKNVNHYGGTVNLKAGESLWFPHRPENGSYYGQTIFKGAYPPWCDKNLNGGAMDVRRLYMHKDAYGGAILYYPNTSMNIEGVGDVPARDIARQITEQYAAGGVSSLPSVYDESGKRLWEWDWRNTGPVPTHILEYPKDLDRELLRGIEIPDEVFMSGGAGSWEGKKVPERGYFSALNMDASAILTAFCKQVIEPLVLIKKGKPIDFDAQLKPFSVQLAELEASGDGKESPTEPGGWNPADNFRGGKRHPSYQPEYSEKTNPFAMSLEKKEYAAELAAAEIVGQAESIVEAASAAIGRRVTKLAVAKAPKGGVTIDGTEYKGGEFIPGKSQEEVDKAAGASENDGTQKKSEYSAALSRVLVSKEDTIRDNHSFEQGAAYDEDGNELFSLDGDNKSVPVTMFHVKQMREAGNVVFTHNHPFVASLSGPDLSTAALADMLEMRAVDSKYSYSASRPEEGWPKPTSIKSSWTKQHKKMVKEFHEKIKAGEISIDEANETVTHLITEKVCENYGIKYSRTKR